MDIEHLGSKPKEPAEDKKEEPEIETVEKELSPETIEKIMEKVQDLKNSDGKLAIHNTYLAGIENIFNSYVTYSSIQGHRVILDVGVLGGHYRNSAPYSVDNPEYSVFRKTKDSIYFKLNPHYEGVNTRIYNLDLEQTKGGNKQDEVSKDNEKALKYKDLYEMQQFIFDHKNRAMRRGKDYNQLTTTDEKERMRRDMERNILSIPEFEYLEAHPLNSDKIEDLREQDPKSLRILKMALMMKKGDFNTHMINYLGVVTDDFEKAEMDFSPETTGYFQPSSFRGVILYKPSEALLENLVQIMIDYKKKSNSQDYLEPIYSLGGHLLWPKKMSYEEVKKFVAERDATIQP
jgi:hypothetical protein